MLGFGVTSWNMDLKRRKMIKRRVSGKYKADASKICVSWWIVERYLVKNCYMDQGRDMKDNAPVKLFCSHLPRQPRGHYFFGGCPGFHITLSFPCLALFKHSNHSFSQCPALIYHTHFSSDPGDAPEGMGAEQFDRRITSSPFLPP